MCEKTLIQQLKSSKTEQAFSQLTDSYRDQIIGFLRSKTRYSPLDSDDIYNKVLLKVWNNIESFREESSFRTWFFQIARNTLYKEFEKSNRIYRGQESITNHLDLPSPEDSPDYSLIGRESADSLRERLTSVKSTLSQKHQEIFELIFEQGRSYKEASEILNCSLGTVMSRVFYARKMAQEAIKSHEYSNFSQ